MEPFSSQSLWAKGPDWERHKENIRYLYYELNKTLKEVMDIMREEQGFRGSTKMYKVHFVKWGWRKNISAEEVSEVRFQLARGQQVQLPVRYGHELGSKRLRLKVEKAKKPWMLAETPSASKREHTTMALSMWHVKAPHNLRLSEQVIRTMTLISDDRCIRRWYHSGFGRDCAGQERQRLTGWCNQVYLAAHKIGQRRDLGVNFQLLHHSCAEYQSLLQLQGNEDFGVLTWATFVAIILLAQAGADVGQSFLRYVIGICSIELGSNHFLTVLWTNILNIGVSNIREATWRMLQSRFRSLYSGLRGGVLSVDGSGVMFLRFVKAVASECIEDGLVSFLAAKQQRRLRSALDADTVRAWKPEGNGIVEAVRITLGLQLDSHHQEHILLLRAMERHRMPKQVALLIQQTPANTAAKIDWQECHARMSEEIGRYDEAEEAFQCALILAAPGKEQDATRYLWLCSSLEEFYRRAGRIESAADIHRVYVKELRDWINTSTLDVGIPASSA